MKQESVETTVFKLLLLLLQKWSFCVKGWKEPHRAGVETSCSTWCRSTNHNHPGETVQRSTLAETRADFSTFHHHCPLSLSLGLSRFPTFFHPWFFSLMTKPFISLLFPPTLLSFSHLLLNSLLFRFLPSSLMSLTRRISILQFFCTFFLSQERFIRNMHLHLLLMVFLFYIICKPHCGC